MVRTVPVTKPQQGTQQSVLAEVVDLVQRRLHLCANVLLLAGASLRRIEAGTEKLHQQVGKR